MYISHEKIAWLIYVSYYKLYNPKFHFSCIPQYCSFKKSISDTSLKLNAILSVDTSDEEEKAEFLREWQVQHLLNEFKRDEKYSCNESIALNEPSKNKSESFTNNSTHEEYNDSDVNYELMARCLQNSSSSMKKFDILQSLLLVT